MIVAANDLTDSSVDDLDQCKGATLPVCGGVEIERRITTRLAVNICELQRAFTQPGFELSDVAASQHAGTANNCTSVRCRRCTEMHEESDRNRSF